MTGLLRQETCRSNDDKHAWEAGERLWQRPELDEAEADSLAHWTLARHAPILSAVMARIHLLWQHWRHGAELDTNPDTRLPRLSWWAGPSTDEFAQLLVASAIEANGTRWMHGHQNGLVLSLDGSQLELRGPFHDQAPAVRTEETRLYQQRYRYSTADAHRQESPV